MKKRILIFLLLFSALAISAPVVRNMFQHPVIMGDGKGDTSHTISGSSVVSSVEVHSDGASQLGGIAMHRHTDTALYGGHLLSLRSRDTHASPDIVQSGDTLGLFAGLGYDGTDYENAAWMQFAVDGTPGSNDMPGRISFWTTPDGSSTIAEAARIDNAGNLRLLANNELKLYDSDSTNYVAHKAASSIGTDRTWTWPDSYGTSGQALVTNGAGTFSFATIAASPTDDSFTSFDFALSTAGYVTGEWAQMTGNSLSLSASSAYICGGGYLGIDGGTDADWSQVLFQWSCANGDNTSSQPADITNCTTARGTFLISDYAWASGQFPFKSMSWISIETSGATTLYIVPRVTFGSANQSSIRVQAVCVKII